MAINPSLTPVSNFIFLLLIKSSIFTETKIIPIIMKKIANIWFIFKTSFKINIPNIAVKSPQEAAIELTSDTWPFRKPL